MKHAVISNSKGQRKKNITKKTRAETNKAAYEMYISAYLSNAVHFT
ncbi:hypothetical protein CHCC14809_3634 [Bacillus licheniformis]|nr:hypothetical protein B4092_0984 [Bacillus licheniformis]KYC76975.1 hypothetical protein B4090_0204 [Bacillus licheniformis]TWJ64594.1 hypothetical protein CHCC5020_3850 [Bacillus licheniformis]TWK18998.1 hypothetical protein CHCC20440_0934 [Bacillus licheniformis]TWK40741.1 hypothetical protein CHCC20368_4575 [Bacillus licheniformis]